MKCRKCETKFDGKKKKPFFLRWRFIVLAVVVPAIIAVSVIGCRGGEKSKWSETEPGEPSRQGTVYENSDAPSAEEPTPDADVEPEEPKQEEPVPEEPKDDGSISPDFKAAMDSYEKFIDEYVAFMKKYNDHPDDLELLSDYADYMNQYADFLKDFEKWEAEELNTAEAAYYIEVQARVSQKLLEAVQ